MVRENYAKKKAEEAKRLYLECAEKLLERGNSNEWYSHYHQTMHHYHDQYDRYIDDYVRLNKLRHAKDAD